MTKRSSKGQKMMTFIVQFEDYICTVSLNASEKWTKWTTEKKMIKTFMVLSNNKVFYAEKGANRDIVNKLEYQGDEIVKTEVFRVQGSSIVTIACDNEVMPTGGQKQAFFVLDDRKRVFYISAKEREQT